MSELKAITVLNAYQLEYNDDDLVYLKSAADKVIAEKDKEIKWLKEERRWRKSSQELPEDNRIVLGIVIRYDKSYYYTLNYRRNGAWVESDYPEYWMPLPSAPKEEK